MPALSIGETLPAFRHTRDSSYHHIGSLKKIHIVFFLFMNDPTLGIGEQINTKQLTTFLAFLHLAPARPNLHLAISFFHQLTC